MGRKALPNLIFEVCADVDVARSSVVGAPAEGVHVVGKVGYVVLEVEDAAAVHGFGIWCEAMVMRW